MEGIIKGVNKKITQRDGLFSLGFIIGETWYNVKNKEQTVLEDLLKTSIKKGNKISFTNGLEGVSAITVLEETKEEGHFSDDFIKFEDLLSNAHEKGLESIETQLIEVDVEKGYAICKAKVTGIIAEDKKNSEVKIGTFEAIGDATQQNCQSVMIKPHFIRMAETRAIARALRWFTNNAQCTDVETSNHIPEKNIDIK